MSWARPDPCLPCGLLFLSQTTHGDAGHRQRSAVWFTLLRNRKHSGPQNASEDKVTCGPVKVLYEQSRIPRYKARFHPPI